MANHLRPSEIGRRQGAARSASRLLRPSGVHTAVGLLTVIVIAVAGCGGGGASGDPGPSAPASQGTTSTSGPAAACQPHGAALQITARDNRFDQQCLAAPAGTPLVITFQNQDRGVVHNLAIYSDPKGTRTLFKGKLIQSVATVDYHVPPLPAGSYFFQCDVHPQTMNGAFVVR